MAELKLTKNELRAQQQRLAQLQRYLPTLQLKKAMLQAEVNKTRLEIQRLEEELQDKREKTEVSAALLSEHTSVDPGSCARVVEVEKEYENMAGVEVPNYIGTRFEKLTYSLMDTPPWIDGMVFQLRACAEGRAQITVAQEKKTAIEHELREVSIRVNLFEKVLIPRGKANIKKIRVFLGDQELAAVGRAKVAKNKIEAAKQAKEEVTRAR